MINSMYTYTKILYVKRTTYIEVFVYYSRKGKKFRPTTGVKVHPKHITKAAISRSRIHTMKKTDAPVVPCTFLCVYEVPSEGEGRKTQVAHLEG